MKFLIDAQLPAQLARLLASAGHDAMHTREMPAGNASSDREIALFANEDGRVVVTKDRDFRDGHLVAGSPKRLLIVTTGNITNSALLSLVESHLDVIISALDEADFVELSRDSLSIGRPSGGG